MWRTSWQQRPLNPGKSTKFREPSQAFSSLRSPPVRSSKLGHVARLLLVQSHLAVSYFPFQKRQHVWHEFDSLSPSIGFIVVILEYPHERSFIGRSSSDSRCIICLRTPPLTGLKTCPQQSACPAGAGLWTVNSNYMSGQLNKYSLTTTKITTPENVFAGVYCLCPG